MPADQLDPNRTRAKYAGVGLILGVVIGTAMHNIAIGLFAGALFGYLVWLWPEQIT
jgi:hypothetical protein